MHGIEVERVTIHIWADTRERPEVDVELAPDREGGEIEKAGHVIEIPTKRRAGGTHGIVDLPGVVGPADPVKVAGDGLRPGRVARAPCPPGQDDRVAKRARAGENAATLHGSQCAGHNASADDQLALRDRRVAGVSVRAGEDELARCAVLDDAGHILANHS